ncbi:hypothetical protein BKA70DRAFT_1536315 [Coprinopsis sp. MPI-PUGE-AT-0042]|nr:hypothetical protein BKA70DRAFT_1536315 [Coprinopsis sp. MPI-PUGE-AT-0042]
MPIQGPIKLDDTYGAALIGVFINTALWGVTTSQTYTYYSNYPKDNLHNTLIVGGLWILDTVQTCFASMAMYYYLISNYGNPLALGRAHWSLIRMIGFIAQIYFAYIAFKLCVRCFRWWGILVVTNFGFGIVSYRCYWIMEKYGSAPAVILAVIAEFLIVVCLCIFLKEKETGFTGTRKIVRAIIFYAINRCLLTSNKLETTPNKLYSMALELTVGKLYLASILATLNSRPVESTAPRIRSSNRATVHAVDYSSRRSGAAEPNVFHPNTLTEDNHAYDLKEGPFPSTFSNSASKLASS